MYQSQDFTPCSTLEAVTLCLSSVDHAIRCQDRVILNVLGFEMLQKIYIFIQHFRQKYKEFFFLKMILFVKVM